MEREIPNLQEFEQLFDDVAEVDRTELTRDVGSYAVIADETIALLNADNRLGIAKGAAVEIEDDQLGDRRAWRVPLAITAHAHPTCEFVWSRLVVDLTMNSNTYVSDMSPLTIEGEPVEIETSVSAGLKFKTIANLVDIEANPSLTRKRNVHFPRVVASGVGFKQAVWDFHDDDGGASHSHRELNLLVVSESPRVQAKFSMRAKLKMKGIAGLIPLLRRSTEVDETYFIAG